MNLALDREWWEKDRNRTIRWESRLFLSLFWPRKASEGKRDRANILTESLICRWDKNI